MIHKILLTGFFALLLVKPLKASGVNIAGQAKVTASTKLNSNFAPGNVADGIIGVKNIKKDLLCGS